MVRTVYNNVWLKVQRIETKYEMHLLNENDYSMTNYNSMLAQQSQSLTEVTEKYG